MEIKQLTEKQKACAVNLAMQVECGVVPIPYVLELFKAENEIANSICNFWLDFDDMTRRVLNMVIYVQCRQHLENCLRVEAINYPEFEE